MLLFYVRHGDPIYNPDSLTEQGQAQAQALVERMKRCNPERIFASSSNRAMLTAKPTAEYLGLEMEVLDWCHEEHVAREFGAPNANGRRQWFCHNPLFRDILNSEEVYKLQDDWWQHPAFVNTNAKSGLDRIRKETDEFFKMLGYERKDRGFVAVNPQHERVALFAHQGFGWAFFSCVLGVPYPLYCTHFDMGHSGLTVLHLADEGFSVPKILQLSNDSHLFIDPNLKTKYQNLYEF